MFNKIKTAAIVFLAFLSPCYAGTIYILNNNNNGMASGSVAVYDETTLMALPGSPFPTIIPGLSGQAGQQMVINADGTRLYIANELIPDGVVVMDTATMLPIPGSPFSSGGMDATGVAINPLFPYVYVINDTSSSIARLDETSVALIGPAVSSGGANPSKVLVNPNGNIVYVMNPNTPNIVTFDATLGPLVPSITFVNLGPVDMVLNPAGTLLYVYGNDTMTMTSRIEVYDAMTLTLVSNPAMGFDGNESPAAITIDSSGTYLYTLGRIITPLSTNIVRLNADPSSLAVLAGPANTGGGNPFTALSLNPTETRLYVGEQDMMGISTQVSFFDPITLAALPGSPITGGISGPISFAFSPLLTPPSNLSGLQRRNDFALIYEYFNFLTWNASTGSVSGYYVYRDGTLIATLSASTLNYADHDRPKGGTTLYSVTAFDENGYETPPISTLVQ